ncbi:helix-turn-helix domain-containing protein [Ramlibacter sp.]|uniref:helix-turn-helix domain-containing protein n=1 Tax=Ramlibacter sp. TaxID=1917967 RepID=UPI003D119E84
MLPDLRLATPAEVCAELGARLRERRLALDITQQDLATRAGIALNAVKKLERDGQSTVATLVRVARALGLVAELDVFKPNPVASIAEMERATAARRQRARGKRA